MAVTSGVNDWPLKVYPPQVPTPTPGIPKFLRLKRPAPAITKDEMFDSLLDDAHKRIKLQLNNNEAQSKRLKPADLSLLQPVLRSVLSGTCQKSVFNLQVCYNWSRER